MAKKKSKSTSTAKLDQLNETGKRTSSERRDAEQPQPSGTERRKTKRRRQIDPTTCEREYNEAEIEFMHALDEYKHASGRMFPTCSEILEVLVRLGYRQVAEPTGNFNLEEDAETGSAFGEDEFENETFDAEAESQLI